MADPTAKKVDPNRSLVNRCLVRLQQQQQNQALPNVERLAESFRIYDELCDHLGVFKEVFRLLESEVYECVYSSEHLTAISNENGDKPSQIKRVPYFVLHKKLLTERDLKREELQSRVLSLQHALDEKQLRIEALQARLAAMDGELQEKIAVVNALDTSIKKKDSEIQGLNDTILSEQRTAEQSRKDYESMLKDVRDELKYTKRDRDEIAKYKTNYENLDYAFQVKIDEQPDDRKRKIKPSVATKEAYVLNDILQARKLEEQLLTVQNLIVEENERFVENYEKQLARFIPDLPESDYRYSLQQMEIQKVNQEAAVTKDRYMESLSQIEAELRYIRRHTTMLQEQLQQLEEDRKRNAQFVNPREKKNVQFDGGPSVDSGNLSVNPFNVNERVFSKYSCVISYSVDGGKSYYDLESTGYCRSCSEKTTVCPHRMILPELVLALQPSTSHLKFTRPSVSINQEMVDQLVGLPALKGAQVQFLENAQKEQQEDTSSLTQKLVISDQSTEETAEQQGMLTAEQTELGLQPVKKTPLVRLMEDYQIRTATDRYVPMRLPLPRLMSLVESFLAELLLDDDSNEYQPVPVLDHFYAFMMRRYLDQHVSYLVTFDFISSLLELAKSNQYCTLFAHALVGNHDGAVLRYLTIVADLVQRVHWTATYDARLFFEMIYPFLGDEELDALLLAYTGFAENKISARLLYEFVLYSILKERESRFLEVQSLLVQYLDLQAKRFRNSGATTAETFASVDTDDEGRRVMRSTFTDYINTLPGIGAFEHLGKQLFAETELALMVTSSPHTQNSAILTFLKATSASQPFDFPLTAAQLEQQTAGSSAAGNLHDPQFAHISARDSAALGTVYERAPQHVQIGEERVRPIGIDVPHAAQIISYLLLLSAFDELKIDTNGQLVKLRAIRLGENDTGRTGPPTSKSRRTSTVHSAHSTRSDTKHSVSAPREETMQGAHDSFTLIPHSRIITLGRNIVMVGKVRELMQGESELDYE